MNTQLKLSIVAGTAFLGCLAWNAPAQKPSAPNKPKLALSIKPQHVADALRAVILSDREVYGQIAAEHRCSLDGAGGQSAVPGTNGLPAPCEALRRGSQAAASKGVEYSYVLRSLTPVNKRNSPETDAEVKGLQFVETRPDLIYTTEELLGGRWYFTAVYPDVALNQS